MGAAQAKTTARAVARFKQLCCLGLPSQLAMPALLGALHEVVPSYLNAFFWADAQGHVANALFENMDEMLPLFPLYFGEFYNKRETEVLRSFTEITHTQQQVYTLGQMLKVDTRTYFRHDLYNQIFRPSRCHDGLWCVVREAAQTLGAVQIFRDPDAPSFSASDQRRINAMLPYLAHALAIQDDAPVKFTESEDEGQLIVDDQARIRYQSAVARRLIFSVTQPNHGTSAIGRNAGRDLFHEGLTRLIRQLMASTNGTSASDFPAPPVWQYANVWGKFVFRAYWLDEAGASGITPEPSRLIGISVRHHEPQALKLLRRIDVLPLSPRQREVCLWLTQGSSFSDIAERLGVSGYTVAGHTRSLYDKLDVHNRAELVNKLLI